jgi:hypothetical protein
MTDYCPHPWAVVAKLFLALPPHPNRSLSTPVQRKEKFGKEERSLNLVCGHLATLTHKVFLVNN